MMKAALTQQGVDVKADDTDIMYMLVVHIQYTCFVNIYNGSHKGGIPGSFNVKDVRANMPYDELRLLFRLWHSKWDTGVRQSYDTQEDDLSACAERNSWNAAGPTVE